MKYFAEKSDLPEALDGISRQCPVESDDEDTVAGQEVLVIFSSCCSSSGCWLLSGLAGCLAGCLSSQLSSVLSCCPLVGSILGAQRCPHIYETFMPGLVGQPSGEGEGRWTRFPYSFHILLHCPNKKHNKLSTVDRMGHWTEEARRAARGRTLLKFAFDGNPR